MCTWGDALVAGGWSWIREYFVDLREPRRSEHPQEWVWTGFQCESELSYLVFGADGNETPERYVEHRVCILRVQPPLDLRLLGLVVDCPGLAFPRTVGDHWADRNQPRHLRIFKHREPKVWAMPPIHGQRFRDQNKQDNVQWSSLKCPLLLPSDFSLAF